MCGIPAAGILFLSSDAQRATRLWRGNVPRKPPSSASSPGPPSGSREEGATRADTAGRDSERHTPTCPPFAFRQCEGTGPATAVSLHPASCRFYYRAAPALRWCGDDPARHYPAERRVNRTPLTRFPVEYRESSLSRSRAGSALACPPQMCRRQHLCRRQKQTREARDKGNWRQKRLLEPRYSLRTPETLRLVCEPCRGVLFIKVICLKIDNILPLISDNTCGKLR